MVEHHALIPLKPLSAKVNAATKDFLLSGTLKMIVSQGWKDTIDEDNDDEKLAPCGANFHSPTKDETYSVVKTKLHEKLTKPKKHFTEATILALMENPRGGECSLVSLGTPATRAGIIDTLLNRQYIEKSKQNLLISVKGKFLIETVITLPSLCSFVALSTTTEWEMKLDEKPDLFVSQVIDFLQKVIPELKSANSSRWEKASTGSCPLCNKGNVVSGKKNWFCSEYKSGCASCIVLLISANWR